MLRRLILCLGLVLAVAGCQRLAASQLNPFNWFGPSTSTLALGPQGEARPLIPEGARFAQPTDARVLIGEVTDLRIDRTADGALVVARGLASTQGFHNAQLVRTGLNDGVLTYEFRVAPPPAPAAQGSPASRSIDVATRLNAADLAAVRTVRVIGAGNIRTTSR
ncbi:MAG: hypothetical protein JJT81_04400 [Rubellimicrobium sp.]|nr:hypothetical protein [Rubellimicrobium sp.]